MLQHNFFLHIPIILSCLNFYQSNARILFVIFENLKIASLRMTNVIKLKRNVKLRIKMYREKSSSPLTKKSLLLPCLVRESSEYLNWNRSKIQGWVFRIGSDDCCWILADDNCNGSQPPPERGPSILQLELRSICNRPMSVR